MLNVVPPPNNENIWTIQIDNKNLLAVAEEMQIAFPQMFDFVRNRTIAAENNQNANTAAIPSAPVLPDPLREVLLNLFRIRNSLLNRHIITAIL